MAAVIDASFAATLFLPDELSARSSEHFASAASTGIIAPALWQVEVTNIVVMAHRRKRINTALVGQIFEIIDRLPVMLESALTLDQRRTTANIALGACPSNGRDCDGSEMSRMRDGGASRL